MDTAMPARDVQALLYREEPGFFFSGTSCPEALLIYAAQSSFHCIWEGHTATLEQGTFLLLPPNTWYMLYADAGVAPWLMQVSFCAQGFPPRMGSHQIPEKIAAECRCGDTYSQQMIHLLMNQLLLSLQRQQPFEPAAPNRGEPEILCRAMRIIAQNARKKLNVPLVAQKTGVSSSYLTALFHKHLPFSPAEYIRRVRLQESRQMIREDLLNFTQIAAALEYSTVHQFSRQFKEIFGITPTEYAKSVKALG